MTGERIHDRVEWLLRLGVMGVSASYIGMYVAVALSRLTFPFELEWREGGSVDHVVRILAGQPLYVAPSLDFVAYTYTPLYFYVSAAAARILGVGFFPLRLISFASSLAILACLFLLVRRETRSLFSGVLAAGLFAATFRLAGAWLDVARVDSLYLALAVWALYLVRFNGSVTGLAAAGVLVALAFLTKQTALVFVAPVMFYALWAYRRRGLYFIGVSLGLISISTLWLNVVSGGWYVRYVFEMAGSHEIVPRMWIEFWTRDLVSLFVAVLFALAYSALSLRRGPRSALVFYVLALGGALTASWSSRLSNGGYNNVLLPSYAWLSVLFGLGLHAVFAWAGGLSAGRQRLLCIYALVVCLIQFATLRYDPIAQIPRSADREAGERLIQVMSALPGEVFVPSHGYLPVLAGKKSYGSGMALFDMPVQSADRDRLIEETRQALRDRRFAAIVLDGPVSWFSDAWFPEVKQYYEARTTLFRDATGFWPVTGMRTRPEELWFPLRP